MIYRVRMVMDDPTAIGVGLAMDHPKTPIDTANRLQDQLWLRAVLLEQRRRTNLSERLRFDARADTILAALDP